MMGEGGIHFCVDYDGGLSGTQMSEATMMETQICGRGHPYLCKGVMGHSNV